MTARLPAHPLAELFPLIEGGEFLAMAEDIREHGVRDRIELLDGAILDGRNRYNALLHLAETGELLGPGWGHRRGGADRVRASGAGQCLVPQVQPRRRRRSTALGVVEKPGAT